jgi:hypothetical protein
MTWKPDQPGLTVASVTASSSSSNVNAAANTVDGNPRARWSSSGDGAQWLQYDLCHVRSEIGRSSSMSNGMCQARG